jgi:hypothetical protein
MATTKISSNVLADGAAQANLNSGASISLTKNTSVSGNISASGSLSANSATIAGRLDFGNRVSNDTIINVQSDSNDITLVRAAATSNLVGVSLKYLGGGNGDENIFEIATDGGGSFKIDQSGDIGINTAPIDGKDLTVDEVVINTSLGIGTTSPSAKLHSLAITEQLRLGYDASNYVSTTVSSAGLVSLDAVGSGAGIDLITNGTRRAGVLGDGKFEIEKNGINFLYVTKPTAPTLALAGVAGLVPVATHNYYVTYVTVDGETEFSQRTTITVTSSANAQVNVTIPISSDPRVIARKIYRSVSTTVGAFLAIINDNTSTLYVDNAASIGSNLIWRTPTMGNTTAGNIFSGGTKIIETDSTGAMRLVGGQNSLRLSRTSGTQAQFVIFNTADEENNVEYGGFNWTSNIFEVGTFGRGSGAARKLRLKSSSTSVSLNFDLERGGTDWVSCIDPGTSSGNVSFVRFNPTNWTGTGGINTLLSLGNNTINMGGSSGFRILDINTTITATGSGVKELLTIRDGAAYKFLVNSDGNVSIGAGGAPSEKLEVSGNVKATSLLAVGATLETVNATVSATAPNLVYNTNTDQDIDGNKTFLKNVVGNGTDNRLPNQIITSSFDILTRESLLRDQMNNMWMPWTFTSSGRTGNRGSVGITPPTLSMLSTNVYRDVLYISISSHSPFHPRGSGAPQRWATNFTFLFEMDTNNQSTANKHLIIGKASSTVYGTMLPSIGDRCMHILWIGNNSLQLNLYYNDTVTSSDVITIPSNLQHKEKYALVWDGTTLSIYGAFWIAWDPQPNLSLLTAVSLETASTNINMSDNEWVFAQTHENDGGLSNSVLSIHYPSFLRTALHPFT